MTSKLTRERLEKIKSWRETYGAGSNVMLPAEEAEELACIALAAMDSEPVAWTDEQELRDVDRGGCGYLFTVNPVTPHADERRIILLYRHAQPAPVVPVTDAMAYAFHHALTDSPLGDDDVEDIKAGLRAALVNVFNTQQRRRRYMMKNDSIPEAVAVAMINAARDITVAKINAKGARFDGYTNNFNWFNQSMKEVRNAVNEVIPSVEKEVK